MNDNEFEKQMEFHHGCFLGRERSGEYDIDRTPDGNNLALIKAFIDYTSRGEIPAPWILRGLQAILEEYWTVNVNAKTVEEYQSLDKLMGLSRGSFRGMGTETERCEDAEIFHLYRWAFDLEIRQTAILLHHCGYDVPLPPRNRKLPTGYERYGYASHYETFKKTAATRYSQESTRQELLSTMPEAAKELPFIRPFIKCEP
jgi:hypothetical protein